MKMCPYCGRKIEKQATVCNNCYAAVEAEKPKEQPKKAEKKPEKE